MSMQVRSGYINPLTMTKENPLKLGNSKTMQNKQTDNVTQLQNKQQQLQTQMLLMKTTGSDTMGTSSEVQKKLEAELETVSAKLRTAKTDHTQTAEQEQHTQSDRQLSQINPRFDLYTPTASVHSNKR